MAAEKTSARWSMFKSYHVLYEELIGTHVLSKLTEGEIGLNRFQMKNSVTEHQFKKETIIKTEEALEFEI